MAKAKKRRQGSQGLQKPQKKIQREKRELDRQRTSSLVRYRPRKKIGGSSLAGAIGVNEIEGAWAEYKTLVRGEKTD